MAIKKTFSDSGKSECMHKTLRFSALGKVIAHMLTHVLSGPVNEKSECGFNLYIGNRGFLR